MRHLKNALFGAIVTLSGGLAAANVAAVLSGDAPPYKEALEGLKAVVGEVDAATLPALPDLKGAKVIVTFGSEAALKKYPASAALVAALLPDPKAKPSHAGSLTRVGIPPAPAVLLERIKSVEAGTLAVMDPGGYGEYAAALKAAGVLNVAVYKVADVADLAAKLPGLKGSAKSLWLPPDPLFMNPKTFGLVAGVCKASGIALIAPMPALAKAGAAAGIAPSFKQQGQAAGEAAQAYLGGGSPGAWVYSDKADFAKAP